MKIRLFISSLFVILIIPGCKYVGADKKDQVCFDKLCVEVEVAKNNAERMKGLQQRRSLDEGKGMIFIFPDNARHDFWMKDTYIPLDMIWMDYSRTVIHIETDVPPCPGDPCPSYGPEKNTNYVLEVNAGYTKAHNIKPGDRARFVFTQ